MITFAVAEEFAARIARELSIPPGQRMILAELLARGPSTPCPRLVFCKPESKSGEVLLGRLRRAIASRGWVIETCYPNGLRLSDPEALRKMRESADGYALSHATFDAMLAAAEEMPATVEPARGGPGA